MVEALSDIMRVGREPETLRDALSMRPKDAARVACRTLITTIRARVEEASATLALEGGMIVLGYLNWHQNVFHPGGYAKGWSLIGVAIPQVAWGWFLFLLATWRLIEILRGDLKLRYTIAWIGFVMGVLATTMVTASNADSPVLPMFKFATLSNLWIMGSLAVLRRRGGT
jgi:hypothetical protein